MGTREEKREVTRRPRKWAFWACVAAFCFLSSAWVFSFAYSLNWYHVGHGSHNDFTFRLTHGTVRVSWINTAFASPPFASANAVTMQPHWETYFESLTIMRFGMELPSYSSSPGTATSVSIPLWMPLITLLLLATAFKKWSHQTTSVKTCGKCGYDLTGNVSGRCPECGQEIPK